MNRLSFCRGVFLSAVVAFGFTASLAWAGDQVENPKYTAWSKFKPGSTSTLTTDFEQKGNKFQINRTSTLVSVADDKVVIETKTSVTVMGNAHDLPATQVTIPAKTDSDNIKMTGEKDIEAMGKTYKCKVYEAKGNPDEQSSRGVPNPDAAKATVYASADVPGGVVRIETVGKDDKSIVFILTATETK